LETPVTLFVLLFSVIVHECAHGLAAERYGDTTARRLGRITLNPIVHIDLIGTIVVPLVMVLLQTNMVLGWAKPVPVNGANLRDPARDQPKVAAAGPASNLLLALVCALALGLLVALLGRAPRLAPGGPIGGTVHAFCETLLLAGVEYNVLLALFNLIPIPPLDGSWILMRFLSGRALTFYASLRPFGIILLFVMLGTDLRLIFFGLVGSLAGIFLGISNLIIAIFRG
jgi:Zn-dependent protease